MELTNGSTKVKIDVMNHFFNGGEIEWMLKDDPKEIWSIWKSSYGEPTWDWEKCNYRKLENPKFRFPTKEEFKNLRHKTTDEECP